MQPTTTTYAELRIAYDAFNVALFDNRLPACLLTLQREKRTYGYFSAARFGDRAGRTTDEIALNPEYFAVLPVVETLQTVAHEMVHLWQAHFGKPGRARYHNLEWADKMESIGLMPSSTGRPGGKRVGDIMADYVIPNSRFAGVVSDLVSKQRFGITWFDRFTAASPLYPVVEAEKLEGMPGEAFGVPSAEGVLIQPKQALPLRADRSNRTRYHCSMCGLNVWGKPSIRVACVSCNIELEPNAYDGSAVDRRAMPNNRWRPKAPLAERPRALRKTAKRTVP